MVPHEPCRMCGLTDDQVRFRSHDMCDVCTSRQRAGRGPRDVSKAGQRDDPRAQVCPTCGGWKITHRAECRDCVSEARRRAAGGSSLSRVEALRLAADPGRWRVPHVPCRLCGLTDDVVRFAHYDVCEVCRMRELRGLGPRDVSRALHREDRYAQVCPTCGGWKASGREECRGCMMESRRREPDVCEQCGGEVAGDGAKLCRSCYLDGQGGVCREPGPHGGRMTRRDLCHRHYQQMWRAGRLVVDSSAYEAREDRFRERAAAVDPSLVRFLEARREREAARERRDKAQRARVAVLRARRREAARGVAR